MNRYKRNITYTQSATRFLEISLAIFNDVIWYCNIKKSPTLKRKRHFDEINVIESCQDDNFQCNQWQKFRQNDDISVSMEEISPSRDCDAQESLCVVVRVLPQHVARHVVMNTDVTSRYLTSKNS